MDYVFLGYFVAFGLVTFLMLRYYTQRVGLAQINAFIHNKEAEINEKLLSGLSDLDDISINLELDVKKYQHLKSNFHDFMHELDHRKQSFSETVHRSDALTKKVAEQNKLLQQSSENQEALLDDIRTSKDTLKAYEKQLRDIKQEIKDTRQTLKNEGDRQNQTAERFEAEQLERIANIQTNLASQIETGWESERDSLVGRIEDARKQLDERLAEIQKEGQAQEHVFAANLAKFQSKLHEDGENQLSAQRASFEAGKAALTEKIGEQLGSLDEAIRGELQRHEQALDHMRDQVSLAGDVLAPYEERVDTIEDRLDTWQSQLDEKLEVSEKWMKTFERDKNRFIKDVYKEKLHDMSGELQTLKETYAAELHATYDTQKQAIASLTEELDQKLTKELGEVLSSPERLQELHDAVINSQETLADIQTKFAAYEESWQKNLQEHEKSFHAAVNARMKHMEVQVAASRKESLANERRLLHDEKAELSEATQLEWQKWEEKLASERQALDAEKAALSKAMRLEWKEWKEKWAKEKSEALGINEEHERLGHQLKKQFANEEARAHDLQKALRQVSDALASETLAHSERLKKLESEYDRETGRSLEAAQTLIARMAREETDQLKKTSTALTKGLSQAHKEISTFNDNHERVMDAVQKKGDEILSALEARISVYVEDFEKTVNAGKDIVRGELSEQLKAIEEQRKAVTALAEGEVPQIVNQMTRLRTELGEMPAKIADLQKKTLSRLPVEVENAREKMLALAKDHEAKLVEALSKKSEDIKESLERFAQEVQESMRGSETREQEMFARLSEEIDLQMKDWEKMTAAEKKTAGAELTAQLSALREQHKVIGTLCKETVPALQKEMKVAIDEQANAARLLEQYKNIGERGKAYEEDFQALMQDVSEKVHQRIGAFMGYADQAHAKVQAAMRLTELDEKQNAFEKWIEMQRKSIAKSAAPQQIEAPLAAFKDFLAQQKTYITSFVEKELNELGDLSGLEEMIGSSHVQLPPKQARLRRLVGQFFTLPQGASVAGASLSGAGASEETRKLIKDFEERMEEKFQKVEKVHTFESNFSKQALAAEKDLFNHLQDSKETFHAQIARWQGELSKEQKEAQAFFVDRLNAYKEQALAQEQQLEIIERENITYSEQLRQRLDQHIEEKKQDFDQRIGKFEEKVRGFLSSKEQGVAQGLSAVLQTSQKNLAQMQELDREVSNQHVYIKQRWEEVFQGAESDLNTHLKDFQVYIQSQEIQAQTELVDIYQSCGEIAQKQLHEAKVQLAKRFEQEIEDQRKTFFDHKDKMMARYDEITSAQLKAEKEKTQTYYERATEKFREKAERILAKEALVFEGVQKSYQKSKAKLEQFYTSVNAVAVMEKQQEKLLAKSNEHEAKLKTRARELIRTEWMRSTMLKGLIDELSGQLETKAKKLERQWLSLPRSEQSTRGVGTAQGSSSIAPIDEQKIIRKVEDSLKTTFSADWKQAREELKQLSTDQRQFVDKQKQDVTKFMRRTQQDVELHKTKLVQELSAKVVSFEKQFQTLTKKIVVFTKQTKFFTQIQELGQQLETKLHTHETRLNKLLGKQDQLASLEARFTKLHAQETKAVDLASEVRSHQKPVNELSARLEENISLLETLEGRSRELKQSQQVFEVFLTDIKAHEPLLNQFKADIKEMPGRDSLMKEIHKLVKDFRKEQRQLSLDSKKLDAGLRVMTEREDSVRSKLKGLETQAELLESHYKDFKVFDEKYNQLDYLIEDIEQRKRSVEEMRRKFTVEQEDLRKLKKDFDSQISLVLKSIHQKDLGRPNKTGEMDKVTTVERLHNLGWSNREIAEHLKMKVYEVEVILRKEEP